MGKGYIHLYTGDGKGKTTAALGLTIRAVGAGLKVAFFQFFKDGTSSEVKILKKLSPQVCYKNFGKKGFYRDKIPSDLERKLKEGWEEVKKMVKSKEYNIIVLDEITHVLNKGIINLEEFINFLKEKPEDIEIILTGRDASAKLIEIADLVTEAKKIKHYFDKGVKARKGIEK
ncbi:cob(I)yrinic acid a,c-diamide adenosyltransferase [Candidatus Pacearchaeota archaeon]|nr:MAG: cob(I)yrinic acid a,c-diamide adenosyltransferase [Candidatus Pacearchaeota archaeon]